MPFAPLEASGGTRHDMQPISEPDEFGFVEPGRELMWPRIIKDAFELTPARMGAKLPQMATELYGAIQRRVTDARLPSETENLGADAFNLGPGLMLPAGMTRVGLARAAGRWETELGALGGGDRHLTFGRRLGQHTDIATNFPDADFWLVRKGSKDVVGTPTREFSPEHIGVRVRNHNLDPDYLFYMFMHNHQKGVFQQASKGTLNLQHITVSDIEKLGFAAQGEFELGAMGGSGRAPQLQKPNPPDFGVNDVVEWANAAGLETRIAGKGESQYMHVSDPANPSVKPIEIRFPPPDQHTGNVWVSRKEGNFIDLGTEKRKTASGKQGQSPAYTRRNEAGEPLTVWENLTAAIKERFSKAPPDESWMTAPGSAIRGQERAPASEMAPPAPEGQRDLFSHPGGAPKLTPDQRFEIVTAAQGDPTRPAKDIIREFRATHGEGGPIDSSLTNLISQSRQSAKASARFGPLNTPEVESLLVREAQGGALPEQIVETVKSALGLGKSNRSTVTKTLVSEKLHELEAKGRVKLYGAGAAAGGVAAASGDEAVAQGPHAQGVELSVAERGFLGALRSAEAAGVGGSAVRIYNDFIQRGRTEPLTAADLSADELSRLRSLVLAKASATGKQSGSIDYPDYVTHGGHKGIGVGPGAIQHILGGFRYKVDESGVVHIEDSYDFNVEKMGKYDRHPLVDNSVVHAFIGVVAPKNLAAHIGRKVLPNTKGGIPVSIAIPAEDPKSQARPAASPDDQLIFDTRRLTSQVRDAADDVPYGRFSFAGAMGRQEKARWAEFTAMADGLRQINYAGSAD